VTKSPPNRSDRVVRALVDGTSAQAQQEVAPLGRDRGAPEILGEGLGRGMRIVPAVSTISQPPMRK
jgi:hypothetical protein